MNKYLLFTCLVFAIEASFAQVFKPGNIAVLRIGDGLNDVNSSTAQPVDIVQYSKMGGNLISTIPVASTDENGATINLVLDGACTAMKAGSLSLSSNQQYLIFTGYDVLLGTASSAITLNSLKTIARVGADGAVDLSTRVKINGDQSVKSVVSNNGNGFWVTAQDSLVGLFYVPHGNNKNMPFTTVSLKTYQSLSIFNGELYAIPGAIVKIGSGLPKTASTASASTNLAGINPYGFVLFDLNTSIPGPDVLYVTDETSLTTGGLRKYSKVADSWVSNGMLNITSLPNAPVQNAEKLFDITGALDEQGHPVIYAVRGSGNNNAIISIKDLNGYNVSITANEPEISNLCLAGLNYSFRGVALTPTKTIYSLGLETLPFRANADPSFKPWVMSRYVQLGYLDPESCPDYIGGSGTGSSELNSVTVKEGTKSIKCVLDNTNGICHRAMIRNDFFAYGTKPEETKNERWFRFSINMPASGAEEWLPDSLGDLFCQLISGGKGGPILAFNGVNGNYKLEYRYSDRDPDTDTNPVVRSQSIFSLAIKKGIWIDWVFHVKFSPLTPEGIIEVWMNEGDGYAKMADLHDIRFGFPSPITATHLDLGVYKWPWKCPTNSPVRNRTIYIDDVKIGTELATFEDLAGVPDPVSIPSQFKPGNLALLRVGNGTTSTNVSNALNVSIIEYTTSGDVAPGSFPIHIPSSDAGNRLVLAGYNVSGGATFEGALRRSANGEYLTFGGYDVPLATTQLSTIPSSSIVGNGTVNTDKVIARIGINKDIDLSTKIALTGSSSMRSVVSENGSGFWVANANSTFGLFYVPYGNTAASNPAYTKLAGTAYRSAHIFNNQLYALGNGLVTVGTGLPTTTATTVNSNPSSFAAGISLYGSISFDVNSSEAGVDLIYVADQNTNTTQGLLKFSKVGGIWTANGTINMSIIENAPVNNGGFLTDLTGTLDAQNHPVIYAVRGTGNNNTFLSIVDQAGYNYSINPVITTLATAGSNYSFKGIAFTPSVGVSNLLPLDLISFKVNTSNNTIQLNWITDNEYNTQLFEIESCTDGISFTSIGTIPAKNLKTRSTYSFTDKRINKTGVYYRLKMVDLDGSFKYSQIVYSDFKIENQNFTVYPNPITDQLSISHPEASANAYVEIYELSGKLLLHYAIQKASSFTTIEVSKLEKGVYLLRFVNGNEVNTRKIIK